MEIKFVNDRVVRTTIESKTSKVGNRKKLKYYLESNGLRANKFQSGNCRRTLAVKKKKCRRERAKGKLLIIIRCLHFGLHGF